jgi:TM2 domain-containing membrane protein YozV
MIVAVSATIVFSSCTVEKRRYMDGYHVEFFGKKDKSGKVESTKEDKAAAEVKEINAAAPVAIAPTAPAQQQEVSVELTASATEELVVTRSSNVNKVAAAKAVVAEKKAAQQEVKKDVKKKKEAKASSMGGEKSQLIAVILCALIGAAGIHRFYMGYIWQGVVQLLTMGGCGVWVLIDFIRLLMGSLEPKDGGWDSTFL